MVLKSKFFIAVMLMITSQAAWCQKIDTELTASLRNEYPEDQVIFLHYQEDLDIKVQGDSLLVTITHYEHRYYLGDQSSVYMKDQVYTNSFYELGELEAYSLVPDGKRYDKIPVEEFKESSNLDSYVFYDDSKTLNFIYPGIQPEAQGVLTYTETLLEPRFGNSYFFQTFIPIDHARFSVTTDPGVEIEFSRFNLDDSSIELHQETLKDGRVQYVFEAQNMKKRPSEGSAPNAQYYVPHVVMRIKSFMNASGEKVSILETADDLYRWYREFITDIATQHDPEVQKIVDSIVDPDDPEPEKVRKVFYWVQENIKYIAFEDGMRGFVPHPGGYVCEKRYGDCKDMASLIVNMLHHAGVEAWFTWVGTRKLPYKYSELPTPMVDNHMIAAYEYNDEIYYLDATAQYQTFPHPSAMIQGKETLIGKGDTYELAEVPVIPAGDNVMNDTVRLKFSDEELVGSGTVKFSGYARTFNAYKLVKSDENNVRKYLTRLLTKGSNKFTLDSYEVIDLYDLDKPIEVNYSFNLSDYHREINDEIYINLNLDKSFQNTLIEETRELPLENDYQYTNKTVSILEIPESYAPSYIPENISYENDLFSFSITYEHTSGNEIIMDRTFQVKYLLLEPEQFDAHNQAVKELTNAYREAIILSKTEIK